MKTETREERIKRLLEARESGALEEVASAKPISIASEVPEKEEEDWEDESRLISSKNQERIKEASQKTAELASQSAKAATKIAEKGLVKSVAAMQAIKDKVQEKKAEKAKNTESKSYEAYGKFRRREEKRFAERVKAEAADLDSLHVSNSRFRDRLEEIVEEQQERSVDDSSAPEERQEEAAKASRSHWLTPKLAAIVVALVVAGIGIAWFVRYEKNADSMTQPVVEATTGPIPEVVQVMPPVEAVLPPPAVVLPTELPPLPEAAPPVTTQSGDTRTVSIPVASKPQQAVQVVQVQKVEPKPAPVPAQKQLDWQKDASKKLDEWGF